MIQTPRSTPDRLGGALLERDACKAPRSYMTSMVRTEGSKQTLWDGHFNRLGSYDSHDGWTRDKYGNPVGRGNLLTTLLK